MNTQIIEQQVEKRLEIGVYTEYNGSVLEELDTMLLKRAERLAPYIKQFQPGMAVQLFGRNEYGEICKVFCIIHRDQRLATKLGVLSVNIAIGTPQMEHHECVGYEDCPLDKYLIARDDVVELGIEEIYDIKIAHNKRGDFFQIHLDNLA